MTLKRRERVFELFGTLGFCDLGALRGERRLVIRKLLLSRVELGNLAHERRAKAFQFLLLALDELHALLVFQTLLVDLLRRGFRRLCHACGFRVFLLLLVRGHDLCGLFLHFSGDRLCQRLTDRRQSILVQAVGRFEPAHEPADCEDVHHGDERHDGPERLH